MDWEFSGFFSPFEEFLAASEEIVDIDQSMNGYWQGSSIPVVRFLFKHLTNGGISNTTYGFVKKHWVVARMLYRLEENVAPWWLREGVEGKELESELNVAAAEVERLIEELSNDKWKSDE